DAAHLGFASIADAAEIWGRARQSLTGLLADFAEHGAVTAISAPNRLAVTFPAKYNSSKLACERPPNLVTLEQVATEAAGFAVKLELFLAAPSEAPAAQPAVSQRQQRAQMAENPLVRQVTEVFKAEVLRVFGREESSP
ncbi:MAG TPA: hypothetical protein VMF30_18275, partial [Pirellulales bacterium]|nr:hypothetical protein [Pirellulales bacterium]